MTITVNGQQKEAYDLLMKKNFALEIVQGKKKVEFRSFSDYYASRFLDKEKAKQNKAEGKTSLDDLSEEIRNDIKFIHFHDYNNSWYLDVELEGIGYCIVDSYDIEPLAEEYADFKDYLADAKENDKLPEDDRPMIFYLPIKQVISTNL